MRMKTFSDSSQRRPSKRSAARNCLIINQFATPGLGSLMAGRFVAGTIQLLLAVAGFGLVMGWFIQLMMKTYRLASDLPPEPDRYPWLGKAGVLIFVLSWLLAWPTTLSVLRAARKAELENPPPRPLPPII
jgi:hypothetical protein